MNQICNRSLRNNMFRFKLCTVPDSTSWHFCESIINKRREDTTNFTRTADGAVLITDKKINPEHREEDEFDRCIFKGTVYHGKKYTRSNKADNTVVHLEDNQIARIENFYIHQELTFIVANIAILAPLNGLTHIMKVIKWKEEFEIIPVNKLTCKAVYINIKPTESNCGGVDNNYVCLQPNIFEVQ